MSRDGWEHTRLEIDRGMRTHCLLELVEDKDGPFKHVWHLTWMRMPDQYCMEISAQQPWERTIQTAREFYNLVRERDRRRAHLVETDERALQFMAGPIPPMPKMPSWVLHWTLRESGPDGREILRAIGATSTAEAGQRVEWLLPMLRIPGTTLEYPPDKLALVEIY